MGRITQQSSQISGLVDNKGSYESPHKIAQPVTQFVISIETTIKMTTLATPFNREHDIMIMERRRSSTIARRERRSRRQPINGPSNQEEEHWLKQTIVPSDMAFSDLFLEEQVFDVHSWLPLFDVISTRSSLQPDNVLTITYRHEVVYRGETILVIETTTMCDGFEIWGQSSSCTITGDGQLKVKICDAREWIFFLRQELNEEFLNIHHI